MTQAPIETRHKDKALDIWMARSAEQAIAQTLANLEAAWADLAEIDRIARAHGWNIPDCEGLDIGDVAAIAAPYRASDPVAEALKAEAMAIVLAENVTRTDHQIEAIRSGQAGQGKIDLVMTALKRGMELARTIEGAR